MTFSNYSVFGLRVRSEIPLPELFEAGPGDVDVTVRLGRTGVPGEFDGGLHPVEDGLLFVEPEVGRYRITGGREIVVEARPGVPDRNVRLFLLGSAFGALLHQRGLLPLHANAVEIGGRAVAFMGESGAGKSTLAAWFHDQGYRIIADDVCVVRFDGHGRPRSTPGLPRLRLWLEALSATGRDASDYGRSYVGAEPLEKYDVPVARDASALGDLEIAAVYLLNKGDCLRFARLEGIEAADAVFANTYRGAFLTATTGHYTHWAASLKLIQAIPIYRLERPWDLPRMDMDCPRILDHVRQQARSGK